MSFNCGSAVSATRHAAVAAAAEPHRVERRIVGDFQNAAMRSASGPAK
jgi:hypothetical protein